MNKQNLHSPEAAAVTILNRLCSILKLQDAESNILSEKGYLKKKVCQGLKKKHFLFSNILSECFYNEENDIVCFLRNVLCYCLLHPGLCHVVEQVAPGSTVILVPWLAVKTSVQKDSNMCGLFYILLSRVSGSPVLISTAQKYSFSPIVLRTLHICIKNWFKQAKEDHITGNVFKILLSYSFQALLVTLRINDYYLKEHFSIIYPFVSLAFSILKENAFDNLNELRLSILAYLCAALKMSFQQIEELVDHLQLKQTLYSLFIFTQQHSTMDFCGFLDGHDELKEKNVRFPILLNNFQSIGKQIEEEKKICIENFSNDQIKHSNDHINNNGRCTNALKHFYFLVALDTKTPDTTTKLLSKSSCIPFSGYGNKPLNLWCPISQPFNFRDEELAKEPARSLHILKTAIITVLSKCATVFVGKSGTGKSHTLTLLYTILKKKEDFSQNSELCNKQGLLWLYLDDDTDPRTLIGAWETGSEPCSFVWKDGVMVRAMKSGRWVVIENIDRCSSDILETIREIVEFRRITIVERSKTVRAHKNFRLFGTITINSVNSASDSSKLLAQLPQSLHSWKTVFFPEFSKDDILFAAFKNFPHLRSILSLLYEAFYFVADLELIQLSSDLLCNFSNAIFFKYLHHTQSRFENFCIVVPLLESHKLILVEEFYHTVALSYPYIQFRNFICGKFGEVLGLSLSQISDVVKGKQSISIENNFVRVGSVAVACNIRSQNYAERGEPVSFHFTSVHAKVMRSMVAAQIHKESVLLVGSTGSGKTSLVQKLASLMNQDISVYNFNDQSESCDLIGRIVQQDLSSLIGNFNETLIKLIHGTTLMKEGQKKDLSANVVLLYSLGEWRQYLSFVRKVTSRVQKKLSETKNLNDKATLQHKWSQMAEKLGRLEVHPLLKSDTSTQQCVSLHSAKFMFEEGALVTAMRKGQWIVLDEINLAPSDVLQRLRGLLTNLKGSEEDPLPFVLTENSGEEIIPHKNFRMFACMNPSLEIHEDRFSECLKTDSKEVSSLIPIMKSSTGKKDLALDIRGCFSEFYVDEVTDVNDLAAIIQEIIPMCERNLAESVATFYLHARSLCSTYQIATGLGTTPHFSLRTLTRAVKFAVSVMKQRWKPQNAKVALMNGIIANFMTGLKEASFILMMSLLSEKLGIDKSTLAQMCHFRKKTNEKNCYENSSSIIYGIENKDNLGSRFTILKEEMCIPCKYALSESESQLTALVENLSLNRCVNPFFMDGCIKDKIRRWVNIEGFPIQCGPELIDLYTAHKNLIITPSVHFTIERIARVLSGSRVPILLEGPTSCGKSSIVKFICQITGHRFVRINNHDHTDVQEYLGQHVVDSVTGKLVFVEGVIAQAARQGHWIILDELNLAPSEVLECLNRLLDGNRELFIPETGETISAHEDFVIFATQNPAGGVYGGRKPLSQAFRNRFIEIACEELPTEELNIILQKRCELPLSFTNTMVNVYKELKARRLKACVFESSSSFMTIRDLLRWGFRKPENNEELAYEGYFLIGERLRDPEEKRILLDILKNMCFKGKHTPGLNYNFHTDPIVIQTQNELNTLSDEMINISLTHSMTRLIALVKRAICNDEPVLLVGETGTGKTSVCQLLATLANIPLRIVNCHQQTESADLLGSLQPVKDRLKFFRLVKERKQKLIDSVRSYVALTEDNEDPHFVDIKSLLNDVIKTLNEKIPIDLNARDEGGAEDVQWGFANMLNDEALSEIKTYLMRTQVKLLHSKINFANSSCEENCVSRLKSSLLKKNFHADSSSVDSKKRQNLVTSNFDADVDGTSNGQLSKRLKVDKLYDDESVLKTFQEFLKSLGASIADLLSSLQQCRSLFQWEDGPLVKCMKDGSYLLLDEISLADDAVLERLNSVLEHERSLVLTEKGCNFKTKSADSDCVLEDTAIEIVKAKSTFRIFATMNPGGDFGKRELSPALRNRFTEIWVPAVSFESPDMFNMISEILYHKIKSTKNTPYLGCLDPHFLKSVALVLQKTVCWYNTYVEHLLSVREVLSWIDFIVSFSCRIISCNNGSTNTFVQNIVINALFHGAFLTCIDAFGVGNRVCKKLQNGENIVGISNTNRTAFGKSLLNFLVTCISENIYIFSKKTLDLVICQFKEDGFAWLNQALTQSSISVVSLKDETYLRFGDFFLPTLEKFDTDNYKINSLSIKCSFDFTTPTTIINFGRIIRASQLPRAILLEGPPGAGKTSIVQSLAVLTGNKLIRINLSEFTDLSDLLGSDLPCATRVSLYGDDEAFNKKCLELEMKNQTNAFHWVDGILINAMTKGYWVLLDELNLASQQVLEGLNALLDHRREIYIPELDRIVNCAPSFRLFAAQNPMADGGGRRGIPRSFLNRFSRISVDNLTDEDLEKISLFTLENVNSSNKEHSATICKSIIKIIQAVKRENFLNPFSGSTSWEYNLRDVFRMLQLLKMHKSFDDLKEAASVVLLSRLCTSQDGYRAIKAISENLQYVNVDWSRSFLCKVLLLQQDLECFSNDVVSVNEKPFLPFGNENVYKNEVVAKLRTSISLQRDEVIIGRLRLNRQRNNYLYKLSDTKCSSGLLMSQENTLARVAYGITYNWPVLITGPPGSGKSSVVHNLANLCSAKLHTFRMTEFFDVSELLGVYEPETLTDIVSMMRHQLGCLIQSISECSHFMSNLTHIDSILERIATVLSYKDDVFLQKFSQHATGVLTKDTFFLFDFLKELETLNNGCRDIVKKKSMSQTILVIQRLIKILNVKAQGDKDSLRFRWTDGLLVQCVEKGDWILFQHAHLASPAFLDRLNSLLEPNGFLFLTECGESCIIRSHSNFRLFFTLDSSCTIAHRVSKALRNRCLEVSMATFNRTDFATSLTSKKEPSNFANSIPNVKYEFIKQCCDVPYVLRQLLFEILALVVDYSTTTLNISELMRFCLSFFQYFLNLNPYLLHLNGPISSYMVDIHEKYRFACCGTVKTLRFADTRLLSVLLSLIVSIFLYSVSCINQTANNNSENEDVASGCPLWKALTDEDKNFIYKLSQAIFEDGFGHFQGKTLSKQLFQEWMVAAAITSNVKTDVDEFYIYKTFCETCTVELFPTLPIDYRRVIFDAISIIYSQLLKVVGSPTWTTLLSILDSSNMMLEPSLRCGNGTGMFSPMWNIVQIVKDSTLNQCFSKSCTFRHVLQQVTIQWNTSDCEKRYQFYQLILESLTSYFENFLPNKFSLGSDFLRIYLTQQTLVPSIQLYIIEHYLSGLTYYESFFNELELVLRHHCVSLSNRPSFNSPPLDRFQSTFEEYCNKRLSSDMPESYHKPSDIEQLEIDIVKVLTQIYKTSLRIIPHLPSSLDSSLPTREYKTKVSQSFSMLHKETPVSLWDIRGWVEDSDSHYRVWLSHFILSTELNRKDMEKIFLSTWVWGPHNIQFYFNFVRQYVTRILNETPKQKNLSLLSQVAGFLDHLLCLCEQQNFHCLFCNEKCASICPITKAPGYQAQFSSFLFNRVREIEMGLLQKGIPQRLYIMKDSIGVSFRLEPFKEAFGSYLALKQSLSSAIFLQDTLSAVKIKNSYVNAQEFLLDFSLEKFLQAGLLDENTKDFKSFFKLSEDIIYLKAIVQCINSKQSQVSKTKLPLYTILNQFWEHISSQCESVISKLHKRQFSTLIGTCVEKSKIISDIFVILYFSSLFQMVGRKVHSLMNYGVLKTSIEEMFKECRDTLRLYKNFLLDHVVSILQHVSPHCRRLISSSTFDAVARFISLLWQSETNFVLSDSSFFVGLLSTCSTSCFLTSRNLLELFSSESNIPFSTISQTNSNMFTVEDFLVVDSNYITSLCTAQIYNPENFLTLPKTLELKIITLDPDNFTAWRSALILSFCSQIDLSVTLAQVQNLSEKVSLLQHLLKSGDEILLVFSKKSIQSVHICPQNSMCRYWSNYICTGLNDFFIRLRCLLDNKQCSSNIQKLQAENFMVFQKYSYLCCNDLLILKNVLQTVSRTVSCLDSYHENIPTTTECEQFLKNPFVLKLLKLFLLFLEKRFEEISECLISANTLTSPCCFTEIKDCSTDAWSYIVCQLIWHISLCRIVSCSSQLSVKLEREIALEQTLQYSKYHVDLLDFEVLFQNATTCVEQAVQGTPLLCQQYLEMEKNDVQHFAQDLAAKLPLRPPIQRQTLSESEKNMYDRLCGTQLLEPLTASTRMQIDQLQIDVSEFVSSTWNNKILETKLPFMFETPKKNAQDRYHFLEAQEENMQEFILFFTKNTQIFCKTIQESYVLFPEITTSLAICFKLSLYSLLKCFSNLMLLSKQYINGMPVSSKNSLGFFSIALDHQHLKKLNQTNSHKSCNQSPLHPEENQVDYLLWLCNAYEYALQHNSFINIHMEVFQSYVFQLCYYYQEDYEKKKKQDAEKFATYIQKQNPLCMDHLKQAETDHDRDKRIALSFFPSGSFLSEDSMNEKNVNHDAPLESQCLTQVVDLIGKPLNTKNSNISASPSSHSEFYFKSHQLSRFMRLFHNLSNTLHLCSMQMQKFYFSRVPCYSSYLLSIGVFFDPTNTSTQLSSFFEEDLLRTTLGYTLVPHKNDVLPKTFESIAPFSMNSLLVHGLLTYHGLQLQNALNVDDIHSDYNALFKNELIFSNPISSLSETSENSADNLDTKGVHLEKNEHASYRLRKIKFQRIQRLLRATPGARFCSSDDNKPASSFYKDAWPAASVGAYPILMKIKEDATRFLVECPEHPVLCDVIQMIDIVTNLPVFTTTAVSLMNILQLVISRCEKWEAFAHRQISLKESTSKLTKYLFLLRNHQLCDWRELRNHREEHFSMSVTSWVPQLIEFLSQLVHEMYQNVKAVHPSVCENIINSLQDQSSLFSKSHIQLLWSYLEQNIFPKPLGEFEARLNIIDMVSYFYKCQDQSSFCENQIANVLKHFVKYAELAKDKVDKSMGIGRKTLDKKIYSLLTITAWDFSKPDTLNYSVQKAHQQLAKAITEFDKYLQTPLIEFIANTSIPDSLRCNNVHMDNQDKPILNNSTSKYSWLENLLTHVIPFANPSFVETNSLLETPISKKPNCISLWITQLTSNMSDAFLEPIYQTFLTEWLLTMYTEIQKILFLLETSNSSHKKYWCTDLSQRLSKIHLTFVTGNTDLSFVVTDVGLPYIGNSTHLLLGISSIPKISKEFIQCSERTFQTQTSCDFLASLLYSCVSPSDSMQYFSDLLDSIPKMWKHIQTSLYRQVRQYTILAGQRYSCHADLLNDNSHNVWYKNCCTLLEATQKYVSQLWNISQQFTEFLDLLHLATLPGYPVPSGTFRAFFLDFDTFFEAIRQFLFFTQPRNNSFKTTVTQNADSKYLHNPLSLKELVDLNFSQTNQQNDATLSTTSLINTSSEFTSTLNLSFTMRVLQILKSTFELFPEFRVFQRDPTITFLSDQSRSILLQILDFINDVIHIHKNVEIFKVETNHSFIKAIMSTENVPLSQKRTLIATLDIFCRTLTRLLQCIPDPVLKAASFSYNMNMAPYQTSSLSTTLLHSAVLEETGDDKQEHVIDVALQFHQSCSLDFSKITNFLKTYYFSPVSLHKSHVEIPQMIYMENNKFLKNSVISGLTLFLSTLDTAIGLAGSGVLILKISTVLFKEGYCSDKNSQEENSSNQESYLNQELIGGTGIGEGDGVNDHTDDIMDSDLLDGYKHEEQENHQENHNDKGNQEDSFSEIIDDMQPILTKPDEYNENESHESDPDQELGDVTMNEGQMENKTKENALENEDLRDDLDSKKQNDNIETENGTAMEDSLELAAQKEEKETQDFPQSETNDSHKHNPTEAPDEVNTENLSESDYSQDLEQDAYHFQSQVDKQNQNIQNDDDINMDSDVDMDDTEEKDFLEDNFSQSAADQNSCDTDEEDNISDKNMDNNSQDKDLCDENELELKTDLSWNLREDENASQTTQEDRQSFANNQQTNKQPAQHSTNDSGVKNTTVEENNNDKSNSLPDSQAADDRDEIDKKQTTHESTDLGESKAGATDLAAQNVAPQSCEYDNQRSLNEDTIPNPLLPENENAINEWMKRVMLDKEAINSVCEEEQEASCDEVKSGAECQEDKSSLLKGLAQAESVSNVNNTDEINKADAEDTPDKSSLEKVSSNEKFDRNITNEHTSKKLEKLTSKNSVEDSKQNDEQDSFSDMDDDVEKTYIKETNEKVDDTNLNIYQKSLFFCKTQNLTFNEDIIDDIAETVSEADAAENCNAMSQQLAKEFWELYGKETDSSATRLCEQLRIVLEPTLKGRFADGFRTGKRLSMRKVVAFIASNFRRDKIWLRRTRPSRRDYRILIALDNTRSMSYCSVGPKALKAIITVCTAFQRLELGETGLCAFGGNTPQLILPLKETAYNEDIGAKIIQSFTFDKESSMSYDRALPDMFNLAFKTFGEVPLSQRKCSLQQMLLILSDGRFNKRAVSGKIHEALTCNIIPIFLIIDPLRNSENNGKRVAIETSQSIYDLKEASWDNDNLHVKNYLDDFPFPFYAVIQSISSIPDVLTDIIRQWIELLN